MTKQNSALPAVAATFRSIFPDYRRWLFIGAALALAGCQTEMLQPAPPPSADVLPQQERSASRETVRTNTVTSADGRTVRTTTTSTGISINLDGPAIPRRTGPQSPDERRNAYLGQWSVQQPDGRKCTLTLNQRNAFGDGTARTTGCTDQALFFVSKWDLRGYEVILSNATNSTLVSLRATAPNRLEGGDIIIWR
jgi:hypothetical protein